MKLLILPKSIRMDTVNGGFDEMGFPFSSQALLYVSWICQYVTFIVARVGDFKAVRC